MGATRYTDIARNMVFISTDIPDGNDMFTQARKEGKIRPESHHYKAHVVMGVYGLHDVYKDNITANEEIRFYVDTTSGSSTTQEWEEE